jgi:dTMP kinase
MSERLVKGLKGKFIVLDGPDGCGKSTQGQLLIRWLKEQGVAAVSFRDPGDTIIGEKIREILLSPEHHVMATATEVLLYMAARAQLWTEEIAPALRRNCVVLDRWLSSTCAYQGFAGVFMMERVVALAERSLERVWPDLTIILDVDLKTAASRLNRPLDRMEQKGDSYHAKVREGFLKLASGRKDFSVIDASAEVGAVHKQVIDVIERHFLPGQGD